MPPLVAEDFGEQTFLAAVLFFQFLQLLRERRRFGFERLQRRLLGLEVASNHQRRRDQLGLELLPAEREVGLLFGLAVLLRHDLTRLRRLLPAVADDHVNVVLHRLGPVRHQVLIYVVGIDQRGG